MQSYQLIPNILEMTSVEKPKTILDIGINIGVYGFLLRNIFDLKLNRMEKNNWDVTIDGLEGASKNPLNEHIYNQVFYDDVVRGIHRIQKNYDVILLIDFLQHLPKKLGLSVINNLLEYTNKALIVTVPNNHYKNVKNNFEITKWNIVDFKQFDYSFKFIELGENSNYLIKFYPNKNRKIIDKKNKYTMNHPITNNRKLTITYILPHKNLTGGLKSILQQMIGLKKRGHTIQAIYRTNEFNTALPDWMQFTIDKEIIISEEESYQKYFSGSDIIIAGFYPQLKELANKDIPVFYWEQGHEFLFGDIGNSNWETEKVIRERIKEFYQQNIYMFSVSNHVSELIYTKYGRSTAVFSNYIDTDFYYPLEDHKDNSKILLVGNPYLKFKGFSIALQALELVWKAGYKFEVDWVMQVSPPNIQTPYPINYIILPSQEKLARIYRNASVFLFTSWYEGFGMPPLEAMASGVPVVSTICGGIESYAQNGKNALLAEPGDVKGLAAGLIYFLRNDNARILFGKNGRKTALNLNIDKGLETLEKILVNIVIDHKSKK